MKAVIMIQKPKVRKEGQAVLRTFDPTYFTIYGQRNHELTGIYLFISKRCVKKAKNEVSLGYFFIILYYK